MAPRGGGAAAAAVLNPRTSEFEFFGPVGTTAITVGLPLVCYGLYLACHSGGCMTLLPLRFPALPADLQLFTVEATLVWLGWLAFILALHLLLPGRTLPGTLLRDGQRLKYKVNGLSVLVAALGTLVLGAGAGVLDLGWVYDNYLPLLTASIVWSLGMSALLYARSFRPGALLALGGNTGVPVYDFFIGRELNPRLGLLDLKEFCELYPGLIGWVALNLAYAVKQYQLSGHVTAAMLLVNGFQLLYVIDALINEPAILTTMDITTDGFGFMLVFGDLTWVPFTYTTQARFLATHAHALPGLALAAIVALKLVGYAAFRGANEQKDAFRRDPSAPGVAHIKFLQTQRGTRLMISGWWGVARHINYTGDWVMGLAWCLPCGYTSIIPYFYAVYFACLLIHRAMRDDHACRHKYGADWDRYCALVKYCLLPGVY